MEPKFQTYKSKVYSKDLVHHQIKILEVEWSLINWFYFFSPQTEMTEENLKWLEDVFQKTVGDNGEVQLKEFQKIVHSKNVSIFNPYSH